MLFNVENGTVNLITGEIQAHDPRQLITKVGGVRFDAEAECPIFDAFLATILDCTR